MKLFTKIALGIAGFFAGVAVICLVVAFSMGFTWSDFRNMVADGKFAFGPEDGLQIHLFDEDDLKEELILKIKTGNDDSNEHHEEEAHYETHEVIGNVAKLDVEYGAGRLEIYYSNVSRISVEQNGVAGFRLEQKGDTLYVKGDIEVSNNTDSSMIILLPEGIEFEKVDFELGASQADICDISADEISILVGAGAANITDIKAKHMELEVGAGQAVVKNLQIENLDVEAGVGEVDVEIAGIESDYNYSLECGIGEVNVGDKSYGGLGAEQNITNAGAQHHMDIECGIGEVNVHFTGCAVNDGTCEEDSHNHHGNTH